MGQQQRLVEVKLADGQAIWAEIESVGGPQDSGLGDGAARVLRGFDTTLRAVASNVRDAVADVAPEKVTVEFGVQLALGKEGLVAALAGTSATAAVKVTLSWSGRPAKREESV